MDRKQLAAALEPVEQAAKEALAAIEDETGKDETGEAAAGTRSALAQVLNTIANQREYLAHIATE